MVIICCLFSGCSKHEIEEIKPKVTSFQCDFEIIDSDLSGQLSVNNEGDLSIIFKGPDIINGTAIRVKEESIIVEVQGISERYSRADTPSNSPALLLYDAFIASKTKRPNVKNSEIVVTGVANDNAFVLTLNGMGFISKADFENLNFIFTNHIELNN